MKRAVEKEQAVEAKLAQARAAVRALARKCHGVRAAAG